MEQKKNYVKISLSLIIALIVISIITISSIAYFNYKKVYEGNGNLPILHINSTVLDSEADLKNIVYNGQDSKYAEVKLNTNGNNINGLVRVKIAYVWSGSLSNITYDDENNLIKACDVNYDTALWQEKNGYLYLKSSLEPDQEVTLFSEITFGNLSDNYRGKKVDLYLICEIYQTANLPEDWE